MTRQLNLAAADAAGAGRSNVRGWLTWWTIHEAERKEADLTTAGKTAGIPDWMLQRLKGRNPRSAWTDATQLGAKGRPSASIPTDPEGSSARYLTRDVNDSVRALVREVNDRRGEKVSAETVAQIFLIGDQFRANVLDSSAAKPEIERLLTKMSGDMAAALGNVDDGRIRAVILTWLEQHFRICVRGTGGVYFIPRPPDSRFAEEIEQELLSIRAWVNTDPVSSLFSIVEVQPGGATTLDVFTKSAIEEIQGELSEVVNNLDRWQRNERMNAGSMAYSTDQMVLRVDSISEKASYLISSLGEEVAVVSALLEQVRKRAKGMRDEAQNEVDSAKAARHAAKAPAPKPTPEAPAAKASKPSKPTPTDRKREQEAKLVKAAGMAPKSGTAAQRKAKAKIA